MSAAMLSHLGAGSSLRHWPPGTNSKTFVPSFFCRGEDLGERKTAGQKPIDLRFVYNDEAESFP
jgi:hypothetical protein